MNCSTPTPTPTPVPSESETSSPTPSDEPTSTPSSILPSIPGVTSPSTTGTSTSPSGSGSGTSGSSSGDSATSNSSGSDSSTTNDTTTDDTSTDDTSKPLDLSLVPIDTTAPVMTLPASRVTGSSLSIGGPRSVSIVRVRLANGKTAPVIKIVSDEVTINDFVIDTRNAAGLGVVNSAGQMDMKGHVIVYLNAVAATLGDDTTLTLGVKNDDADTKDVVPAALFHITLGLVGLSADELSLIPSHEAIS